MRENSAALLRTLSFVALDREVAADACQEAFLQLYLHWEKVSTYEDPVAWLYRAGINRCRDGRRKTVRKARLLRRLEKETREASFTYDWDPDADLLSVLSRLPLRQRTACVLFYQADLAVEEIASLMHISQGAVSSHLYKAREALRQVLEEE